MDLRPAPTTAPTKADPKLGRIVMLQLVTIVAIGVVGALCGVGDAVVLAADHQEDIASQVRVPRLGGPGVLERDHTEARLLGGLDQPPSVHPVYWYESVRLH